MTDRLQREAYERREAQNRVDMLERALEILRYASANVDTARLVAMGEWSQRSLTSLDDIKFMLIELRETAEADVREQMELLSESPIISEKDI